MIIYDVDSTQPVVNPVYLREPPWKILLADAGLVLRQAGLLLVVLSPLPVVGVDITWIGIFGQIALIVGSIGVSAVCLSSLIGFPAPLLAIVVFYGFICLSNWVQGVNVLQSQGGSDAGNEAWLFVNGIATSPSGTQLIVNRLEVLFQRPVIAIHNRTQGIWFDLLECFIQRDLLLPTDDARQGYAVVSAAVRDPTKRRVVLISHSQGGIILSGWVDQLLNDFGEDQLAKVEVYTFANAANHFSSPAGRSFSRIEHFANNDDFVARIGVLAFAPPYDQPYEGAVHTRAGRYAGRIFKRDATGHLLLSHYLHPGSSFLDHPAVRETSTLASYLGGENRI